MQILIQIKAIVLAVFLLIFVLVPANLLALPFALGKRLKIVGPAWAFFGDKLLRYGCHAKIAISEDHRSERFRGTPCYGLYVANHQSYMDIPLILTLFQAPPIMKRAILHVPIFGWIAWVSGALAVSRTQVSSRRQVFEKAKKRVLKEKIGLQVYPEGTRSKTSLPKSFTEIKKTLLIFAFNEKIPVVPVSIYGTRGILNSFGMINPGRQVGLYIHKEVDPKDFDSAEKFAETCWEKVITGHDQMREKLGPLNENLSLA